MDLYNKEEYSFDDIEKLISNEVEENIHLDYKAAGALDKKDDKKRNEITKDISAFANSDGGIIVYGVSEEDHRPEPIYPNEQLNMGHFEITVKKENNALFLKGLVIDMILFYPGGNYDLAYIPSTKEFIEGRDNINKVLDNI